MKASIARPSSILWLAAGLLLALPTGHVRADAIADLLQGKQISYTVSCSRAGRAVWRIGLNEKGNLLFTIDKATTVIIDGSASDEYGTHSATANGQEIVIVNKLAKLNGVSFTDKVRIYGNS